MKNLNKLALILAVSVSAVSASSLTPKGNFTGFYAGVGAGLSKKEITLQNAVGAKVSTNKAGLSLAAFGGYGHQINNLYLAFEIAVKNDFAKPTMTLAHPITGAPVGVEVKELVTFAASPKIGFTMDNFLFYIKPGFEYSALEVKNKVTSEKGKTDSKITFAPGLGMDFKMNRNLFTRFEYTYKKTNYDDKKEAIKGTRKNHNLTVAVGYIF